MIDETAGRANASTPSETRGAAWAKSLLSGVEQMVADYEITDLNACILRGKAEFAARRNVIGTCEADVNLWGYGAARAVFQGEGREVWIRLDDLVEPSGLTYGDLLDEFRKEIENLEEGEQPNVDVLCWTRPDGKRIEIPLCTTGFALEVMAGRSPWAPEVRKALFGVFRIAAVQSGLADQLGLTEAIAADGNLPTPHEAKVLAFRGPVAP